MVGAYLICLDEVTYSMIKKGFMTVVPILTELKRSLVPQEGPAGPTHQKVTKPHSDAAKVPKAIS